MLRPLLFNTLLVLHAAAHAGELRLAMPTGESLVFSIPKDWRSQTKPTIAGQPETGRVTSPVPGQLEVLVTAILPANESRPPKSRDNVRTEVQNAAANAATRAAEKQLLVQDLAIPGAHGYYFFATDRAPKPGEYKYLIQGQFVIRELTVVFTALMNGDSKAHSEAALAMIRSAKRQ